MLVSVSIGYWIDQYMDYAMFRVTEPSTWDITMGTIAIVMIMETARRALGPVLVFLSVIFLVQIYFGPYLPGKLSHAGMSPTRIIEFTFCTQEAMFGVITATFATFVFPFMIFGASALLLLLPVPLWVNLVGFILLGIGWVPGIIAHRKTAAA